VQYRLIYDGLLTLNLGGENKRTKNIELHVLLLEECVMFLQKQDEKFLLKFHTGQLQLFLLPTVRCRYRKAVLWNRIGFKADPDPAFYPNTEPRQCGSGYCSDFPVTKS
jgi:hypothetical protein